MSSTGNTPPSSHSADATSIIVAEIAGVYGVKGQVWLKCFLDDANLLKSLKSFTTPVGTQLKLASLIRGKQGRLIAGFAGLTNRDDVAKLVGCKLSVLRERLPQADPGEFYITDLIGCEVLLWQSDNTNPIGRVENVLNYGAGDLLEIAPQENPRKTILIPFTQSSVPHEDIQARQVFVDPETWAAYLGFSLNPKDD